MTLWLVGRSGRPVVKLTFGWLVGWLVCSTEIVSSLCWRCWNILQFLVRRRRGGGRGGGALKLQVVAAQNCIQFSSTSKSSTSNLKSFFLFCFVSNNFEVNKISRKFCFVCLLIWACVFSQCESKISPKPHCSVSVC